MSRLERKKRNPSKRLPLLGLACLLALATSCAGVQVEESEADSKLLTRGCTFMVSEADVESLEFVGDHEMNRDRNTEEGSALQAGLRQATIAALKDRRLLVEEERKESPRYGDVVVSVQALSLDRGQDTNALSNSVLQCRVLMLRGPEKTVAADFTISSALSPGDPKTLVSRHLAQFATSLAEQLKLLLP